MNADCSGEVLLERYGFFPSWFPTWNKIAFRSHDFDGDAQGC